MARRRSRAARWLGIDSNELRRPSDRAESAANALALTLTLLAVPFALSVGSSTYADASAEAAAQVASGAAVQASVVEQRSLTTISTGRSAALVVSEPGKVAWTTSNGEHRSASAQLPAGAAVGSEVTIWLDSAGNPSAPPKKPIEQLTAAFFAAILVLGGILSGLVVALCAVRLILNRHRYADWTDEWARVGPEWSRPWRPHRGDAP